MSVEGDLRDRIEKLIELRKDSPFTVRELILVEMAVDNEFDWTEDHEWWGPEVIAFMSDLGYETERE